MTMHQYNYFLITTNILQLTMVTVLWIRVGTLIRQVDVRERRPDGEHCVM